MRFSLVVVALLLAPAAWAQRVVLLEIDSDPGNKLRAQVEGAIKKGANTLELVPIATYRDVAAKKKLRGAAAMTAAGVARVGKVLKLDAAVGGDVSGGNFNVVIYDRAGQELWTKSLAVKKGLLSEDFARKLARAITAAADTGAQRAAQAADSGGAEGGGDEGDSGSGGNTMQEVDLTGNADPGTSRHVVRRDESPDRDADLDSPVKKKAPSKVYVPVVRFWLSGTTTWRSQCLRPGVSTCKEYDQAAVKPDGIIIDFTASVPYLGFSGNLELFPMGMLDNRFLQGWGLLGAFSFGASVTNIIEETPQGKGDPKPVNSTDLAWSFALAWRYHFLMGFGDQQPTGYAGLRLGDQARRFDIDPKAGVSLPSSQRVSMDPAKPTGVGFLALGVDLSLPLASFLRVQAGGTLYVSPRPSAEQVLGYGNPADQTGGVTSNGFSLEYGVAGDIWQSDRFRLGYEVKVRHMFFNDRYYGQGMKWTVCTPDACGGAAEEAYSTIHWGLTASY